MATNEQSETSDEIRNAGNDLSKSGKFVEAIDLYNRAVELDPSNAAPKSNLAAAHFELGVYASAIGACDAALSVLTDIEEHKAPKQKLLLRKARSCLNGFRFAEARSAVGQLQQSAEQQGLQRCIDQHERNSKRFENREAASATQPIGWAAFSTAFFQAAS